MAKPRRFSDATEDEILAMWETTGANQSELAEAYGCSPTLVRAVIRRARARREWDVTARDKVVAGDKANGQLRMVSDKRYEGTWRRPDGKFERKVFNGSSQFARRAWEKWKEDKAGESEFMAMVNRENEAPTTPTPRRVPEEPPATVPESDGSEGETPVEGVEDAPKDAVWLLCAADRPLNAFGTEDEARKVARALNVAAGDGKFTVTAVEWWSV